MSLTRGPPRSFFFGCIPPLLRPFVFSRVYRACTHTYTCIATRIRIVTRPPPATCTIYFIQIVALKSIDDLDGFIASSAKPPCHGSGTTVRYTRPPIRHPFRGALNLRVWSNHLQRERGRSFRYTRAIIRHTSNTSNSRRQRYRYLSKWINKSS